MKENRKELEQKVTEIYRRDTNAMVLVFAQWCINHDLEPISVYEEAYPEQAIPAELQSMLALTVPKEEAGDIALETLMNVLLAFDNERLAAVVQQKAEAIKKS
ncbi:hypothetical protein [Aneurinibacillus migulanus]|uniref:hypothetical protein n=1 Tax=Aneurinibacillus migulanus TaxID=47500 RepID=UPI0020A12E05|nr:hypothetical protein [Aneurinibacillus migulanus]MCP1357196.1 hypothetical protein [Aneurinibacillus migulanus]